MQNPASTAAQAAAAKPNAAPERTEAEIKAQGIQEYKARASAVKGIFAGLPVDENKLQEMIDGEKSIADLTAEALSMAKEQIKVSAEAAAKAAANTKPAAVTDGMTPEQVAAVKDGLEAQASAQNAIVGGSANPGESDLQKVMALCADVQKEYYK